MCQCLAVEATHPSSPGYEDCSASEAATPVPVRHVRPVRAKRHKQPPAPAAPAVVQLMEMGFPRRNIEFALKSLAGTAGNATGSPGIAVSLCLPSSPQPVYSWGPLKGRWQGRWARWVLTGYAPCARS